MADRGVRHARSRRAQGGRRVLRRPRSGPSDRRRAPRDRYARRRLRDPGRRRSRGRHRRLATGGHRDRRPLGWLDDQARPRAERPLRAGLGAWRPAARGPLPLRGLHRDRRGGSAPAVSGPPEDDAVVESDEVLVKAFVAGDESAFDTLVQRHSRRVYAICLRYFGNPGDAEDAAQEAFLALYRRASTFSGAAPFSTWMYRVATNACNDLARKRARRPQTTTSHDLE